jgi:vacuolar-type H+-ATPase subunit H
MRMENHASIDAAPARPRMALRMASPKLPPRSVDDDADQAIGTVLRAEADARESIARCQAESTHIAEAARAQARALAERTERRIRAVVAAFERERAARLAEIDAEASAIHQPQVLAADALAALEQAVQALARELTGGPP